ncbi:LAMI_0D06260g1_1 [Lachancea mirantina]|uniref:LAMI_0D06260g1_1 n=1 Tax=Lachancea mirantina TaxID=1230905 RepID=A0A1G4JBP1_9SACH|nr:LAMI_0D06260g1_1 [Lachancea mirantina]
MSEYSLGYYDTIAGLSGFECSHKVRLSLKQLEELTSRDVKARKGRENVETLEDLDKKDKKDKKRPPVHGYLGKIDAAAAANVTNEMILDTTHVLLGGHVPIAQLEALSSSDFALYFKKNLECEVAMASYDHFVNQGPSRQAQLGTPTPSSSATPSAPQVAKDDTQVQETNVKPKETDGVKKVILCKRCKARFSGPRRFTNMRQHMCMRG